MASLKINFCGILIIVAGIAATKAEVDCRGPPPFVDISDCCELSNIISEDIKEKCTKDQEENNYFGQHGGPPDHPRGPPGHPNGNHRGPPHHHGPHNKCFSTCAVNETGILIDGEIQEDNMNSYLNEVFDDSEQLEFLSNKLMSCYEKHKEFESNRPDRGHHGPAECSPKHGGMLIHCVHMESFKECPESFWLDTDECNAAREHFTQCKRHHGPPPRDDVNIDTDDIF